MSRLVAMSGNLMNSAFLGMIALSSLWYCYIRQGDLAIRRRELRMNVITSTLTLTAGVIGSYLSARTRRDSIAHALVAHGISATKKQSVDSVRPLKGGASSS